MARTRTYDQRQEHESTLHVYPTQPGGKLYTYVSQLGNWGSCDDVVGSFETDNPFDVDKYTRLIPTCSGTCPSALFGTKVIVGNHPPDHPRLASIPDAASRAPVMNWADLAWTARQRTDPQRPDFSLPQVIGEAGDLPSLLTDIPTLLMRRGRAVAKRFGRRIRPRPRKLAPNSPPSSVMAEAARASRRVVADGGSQYVGVQFGWMPVMRDLSAMLGLQASIAQRLGWLLRLLNGQSIKRRMMLPSSFVPEWTYNKLLQSHQFIIRGDWVDNWRTEHWVTARWTKTPFFSDMVLPDLDDPSGLIHMAARLATGMNKNGLWEAWWELLPWSWLIDWWYNVGRLMAALMPGALYLRLESLCYCRTSRFQRFYVVTQHPSWLTISDGPMELAHTSKLRKDLKPYLGMEFMRGPSIGFPDLNPGQWAILAGLLAQKLG